MKEQLLKFGAVGIAALLVHYLVVLLLVPQGVNPLVANMIAFIIAFQVSYFGHAKWTFGASRSRQALLKFVVVSGTSFSLNELLFFILLHFTSLPYELALFLVLGFVACLTFVLSRQWAFKSHDNR